MIFGADAHIVVALVNIECSEQFLSIEVLQDLFNSWYRIDVPDCPAVYYAIVL